MNVRIPSDQSYNCKVGPLRSLARESIKRDQKRKSPELQDDCGADAAIYDFAEKGG